MAPERMIVAEQVSKQYGTLVALGGLDLCVSAGTIYALLGPNGAGKTTTISILTTLITPTAGSAQVAGYDVVREARRVRERIGVTFQDLVLDQDLTGRQILDIHGRLYRMPAEQRRTRIGDLVDMVRLNDAIDRRVKTYSGGMKRRLELARGLMTQPAVLFLDEPTQGLDPQNRATIWEYVLYLKREHGMTLLLTTHAMEEAEALADTVGILDHGSMITQGSPRELSAALGTDTIRLVGAGDPAAMRAALEAAPFVERVEFDPAERVFQVSVDNGTRRLAELVALAAQQHFMIDDLAVSRPTLGDVFLKHTGRALRD
ncbi:MAG TPA: ATP-binding cassette domain-containing protein [Roseiflexaceae bacterium]|nr:ATP-binding cassette domain-containing protein [Roseiflexaceae bacterium]